MRQVNHSETRRGCYGRRGVGSEGVEAQQLIALDSYSVPALACHTSSRDATDNGYLPDAVCE